MHFRTTKSSQSTPRGDFFPLRVETSGAISWLPENVRIRLPEGFKALTVRDSKADARSESDGDEETERAGELLLEELISLEQAFQQGAIGRKTYEQTKRQLLEAFARLRAEPEPAEAA
jgi:hypothetical protein